MVSALKAGETDIVVSSVDFPEIKASCRIIVNPILIEAITLNPEKWIGEEEKH